MKEHGGIGRVNGLRRRRTAFMAKEREKGRAKEKGRQTVASIAGVRTIGPGSVPILPREKEKEENGLETQKGKEKEAEVKEVNLVGW